MWRDLHKHQEDTFSRQHALNKLGACYLTAHLIWHLPQTSFKPVSDSKSQTSRQFLHFPLVAVFGSCCCLRRQPVEACSLATNVPMFIIPCVNLCNESMLNRWCRLCPYHALQCSDYASKLPQTETSCLELSKYLI